MSDYSIWWIDDSENREEVAHRLGEFVEELEPTFDYPSEAIKKLNGQPSLNPDLVLIDWKLNEETGFPGKGLTMAGKVREEYPGVPIYGFSDEVERLRTSGGTDHFEDTFDASEFKSREGAEQLKQDCVDFEAVDDVRGRDLEALINLLDPPEEVREKLMSLVPREYTDGLSTDPTAEGGSILEFVEWLRYRFLETPGPLWNDDWVATKIGLDPDSFPQYEDQLINAVGGDLTYRGIFSHRNERRWWATLVIDAVVAIAQDKNIKFGELATAGEQVFDAPPDHLSACAVCDDPRPETLAAGNDGRDATTPVHLYCSHVHHSREGAFEDYRVADELS